MGIVLISIAVTIIISIALACVSHFYKGESKQVITCLGNGLGWVLGLVIGLCIIIISRQTSYTKYDKMIADKNFYEYCLRDKELKDSDVLIQKILDFNTELEEYYDKQYNLWVNWFYDSKIATIDYIYIDLDNE